MNFIVLFVLTYTEHKVFLIDIFYYSIHPLVVPSSIFSCVVPCQLLIIYWFFYEI